MVFLIIIWQHTVYLLPRKVKFYFTLQRITMCNQNKREFSEIVLPGENFRTLEKFPQITLKSVRRCLLVFKYIAEIWSPFFRFFP